VETGSVIERNTTGAPWMAAPQVYTIPHAKIAKIAKRAGGRAVAVTQCK
jgi:hypothetical protein